jgi:deazaflavin-dependent oxidoreductase (nitroreductase family)
LAFRLPIYLYRYRLGWLLGNRFVLIHHVGRKSGLPRQTVVELVERSGDSVVVVAGYGPQTQWYQNLQAQPITTIEIGRKKQRVKAQLISPSDGEAVMMRYFNKNPRVTGGLMKVLGYQWDGTLQGIREIANQSLRFVQFDPA